MNNRFEISYYPSTINHHDSIIPKLKRQDSYFDLYDLETDEESRYTFVKSLGAGTYGYVRLFEDDDGNRIAVKALKPKNARHLTRDRVTSNTKDIESEFNFLQLAYADEIGYSLHLFEESDVEEPEFEITESEEKKSSDSSSTDEKSKPKRYLKGQPGIHASYRMTIPFVAGKNLCTFAEDEINHQNQMAKLMLQLAEELQRLHDLGVIHADIGSRNVLVTREKRKNKYHIHFIDFGMAYKKNGDATVNFHNGKKTTKSGKKISSGEMAPERYADRKLKAHPRQDVYSLAKTFHKMVKHRDPSWLTSFELQYPLVKKFMATGTDITPENRPSLPEFIIQLKNHIDCQESLPANLSKLVFALEQDGMSAARKLLESKSSLYTREKIAPVLYRLVKNGAYNLAEKLMELRKGIPLNKDVNGDHILALAAADANMEDYLFASMLDYIYKNQLLTVISKQNEDGHSALHGMTATHRLHYLMEKLELQANILAELRKTKLTATTTREAAALQLLAYLVKLKNEVPNTRHHHFFKANATRNKKAVENAVFYLIEKILMIDNEDGDELNTHETVIHNNPQLAKLHRDLLANNLIGSPEAEEGIFSFLPRLWM